MLGRSQSLPLLPCSIVVACTDKLIEAEVDDEIVALNIEHGTCYGLNRVGSRIWQLLAEPIRIRDLCLALRAEYEVDGELCQRHVLELLSELHAEGLIATLEER